MTVMQGYVAARWSTDGDGTGQLHVRATAKGFSGEGAAWFGDEQVRDFAASLDRFPLPDTPLILNGGFWARDGSGKLEQELVSLAFYPVQGRGQIGVGVHLAEEWWPHDRSDSPLCDVRLEVLTTYERLRAFSRDLAAIVSGRLAEAKLEQEYLM
jgi:hypothetical protein